MSALRQWRLSWHLAGLLLLTCVITFVVVGSTLLVLRMRQIETTQQARLAREAMLFAGREEAALRAVDQRMALLARSIPALPPEAVTGLLDEAVSDGGGLRAVYLVSVQGEVIAAGLGGRDRERRAEVLGSDLGAMPLVRAYRQSGQGRWGDKLLSALSGEVTVGRLQALPDGRLLLAEVPLRELVDGMLLAGLSPGDADRPELAVWIVDGRGEVLADSMGGRGVGRLNLADQAVLQGVGGARVTTGSMEHEGVPLLLAASRSEALGWTFVARSPTGWHQPQVRDLVSALLWSFGGLMAVGLLLAPFWARSLTRPLGAIVRRAQEAAAGSAESGGWPRGPIEEFNRLSASLERVAGSLQEREVKLAAVFNTAPVPMAVTDLDQPERPIIDANDAWCRQFGWRRADVIGRSAAELNLWTSRQDRDAALAQLATGFLDMEAWMRCADQRRILCRVSARTIRNGSLNLMIWANEDITELRRTESSLRELNQTLEARVAQRTQALEAANVELTATLGRLESTRDELVRAEKMAALGSLVAGVAHELNTPLGNSLMAISTLRDDARVFRDGMSQGVRKAALDELLGRVEQATGIASRNLERAADLVTSFKQVAVDQTSSQRRRFDLAEVVSEIVLTLRPSFARTPYRIEVDVAPDLYLDSYPGPLGQILTNLMNNAVLHGFDERDHGTIVVRGRHGQPGQVIMTVSDDGKGIPASLVDRIFDPFVTTRMGRGGTGLGLNIAFNVATGLLGGSLSVHSTEGHGATFTLTLPVRAPEAAVTA
jgi:PAS domain S-box-containing protein